MLLGTVRFGSRKTQHPINCVIAVFCLGTKSMAFDDALVLATKGFSEARSDD